MRPYVSSLIALSCLLVFPPLVSAQSYGSALERPVANPVVASQGFQRAVERETRTTNGIPGPRYWQQSAEYTITARLDVDEKRLEGTTRILYRNESPDSLRRLVVQLIQNFHRDDAPRIRSAEITGGYSLSRVVVAGEILEELQPLRGAGWAMSQTNLLINPPAPVAPGSSVVIEIDWSFLIPAVGAGGRMGWNDDNFFYLAYWYPQMAVYDDVVGWHTDPFLGMSEFYSGFAEYDVTLDVPQGWLVQGTGELQNEEEVLAEHIIERLRQAEASDEVVRVITEGDLLSGYTRIADDGRLRWRFTADSVRDAAYSVTRESLWDVVRADVGDRDGDGRPEYSRAEAIFRPEHQLWHEGARYAQHSLWFHSRQMGLPYPYSHGTAVEGAGIIGGGMEHPMMTIIGGYDNGNQYGLYGVISHELAHNWLPMIVSIDERRRAWMDEGTTNFNTADAFADFFPDLPTGSGNFQGYTGLARTGHEGALMRFSDRLDSPGHYGVHGYSKPASLLISLRNLLGAETFNRAYHGYVNTWAYKLPKPWDFFNYFNAATGEDLDWFWQTWYYETWTLDQTIESVTAGRNGTEIVVRDNGDAPMPTRLTITLADGETLHREIPVKHWLSGTREAVVMVPAGNDVTRVEIDPDFPDVMGKNNFWDRQTDDLPSSWPLAVRSDLVRRSNWATDAGFRPEGELLSGSAAHRTSDTQAITLEGGVEYAILAVCGDDCSDIDLTITSPSDSTLATDTTQDDWPRITFTAPVTGQYDLTLTMYTCRSQTCAWGGQIFRR